MREFVDTVAWLWGSTWPQHGFFIFGCLLAVGAFGAGWTQSDTMLRLNRKLRREDQSLK